ncbi:hypothetical protein BY996DRAFT_7433921 [Phakopsora pachyrhizi]|nr:hypothetical protein BY996DRAFT_7433921 [Phakopsora pachyrhizi]
MILVWVLLPISGLIGVLSDLTFTPSNMNLTELFSQLLQIPFSVPWLVTELCHSQLLISFCSYFFLLNFCNHYF